ncbi:MAG: MBL fold metallo-hydrolase [Bacteroidota bacterium]
MKRPPLRTSVVVGLGLLIAGLAACAGPRQLARVPESPVVPVAVGISNAYLILGERVALVDPGPEGETDALEAALMAHGRTWADVSVVVLTHGHADHAGGAAEAARLADAPVVAGEADLDMLRAGDHGHLTPMGIEAAMIRPFLRASFPPVEPEITLAAEPGRTSLDLSRFGVDALVFLAPGHTPGSLAVLVGEGSGTPEAIVGDAFRGGAMGGRIRPQTPYRHYFHEDAERAEALVPAMLRRGVTRFFVGHGGPVSAEVARARFAQ